MARMGADSVQTFQSSTFTVSDAMDMLHEKLQLDPDVAAITFKIEEVCLPHPNQEQR